LNVAPLALFVKNFLGDLSNSGTAIRLSREGRQTGRPKDKKIKTATGEESHAAILSI
jgi:hypothetical protein